MEFENILVRLVDQIVRQTSADDDVFEDFNFLYDNDEKFDDLFL